MKKREVKTKRSAAGRIFQVLGIVVLTVVILAGLLFGFLAITEYKPADVEAVETVGTQSKTLAAGDHLTVMTWNLGYGALGDNADFFMDGGSGVQTADEARLDANLQGIMTEIWEESPDLLLLQEVDRGSTRSLGVDEFDWLCQGMDGYVSAFANNFKVAFLPYPLPPIGTVDSGVATLSAYAQENVQRVQLPIPFSWPVSMVNLKRCVMISRIPVAQSEHELVVMNLHLEAYDDGEGKAAQTAALAKLLEEEAAKGNYVIAGGDFNQVFSSVNMAAYPAQEGKWQAGKLDETQISGDWQFMMDADVPTCRSLDQPYAGADKAGFQYYVIDGFIVSSNVNVEYLETQDLGFVCTDHNPVLMRLSLQ